MDVALELVTHCAPDHPWVTEHPAWFGTVSDGAHEPTEQAVRAWTDIVPLRFDSPDPRVREELYLAVRSVIEFWVGQGVQLFRADNPHTKPVTFWERLLADLKSAHPDVVLLAEAFTRPVVQRGLSRLGFCQSLTYFMWRTDKHELVEFVQELVSGGDTLRPNLFPANHDVIPENLQGVPTSAFAIRAALAALISPAWGISSGYEICEGTSAGPGSQRWRHSEKYELRPRDWESARRDGRSIEDWLRTLNQVRARHPALRQLRTLRLHPVDHADLVAFSKQDPATGDVVLCVVSLDPHGPVSARLEPPVELPEAPGGWWRDEVTGRRWDLSRPWEVRLDPAVQVAAVLVPAPDGAPPADPTGRGPA
jgi:starch synthase (maltosyl-transferring)